MKSCVACGTALVDSATVCNRCGAPVWQQQAGYAQGPYPTPPSASSNKGLFIVLGVVFGGGLLLMALAFGVILWTASASRQMRRNIAVAPATVPQPAAATPVTRPGPPWVVISNFQTGRRAGLKQFTLDYQVVQGTVGSCLWIVEADDGTAFEFHVNLRQGQKDSLAGRPVGASISGRGYTAYLAERDVQNMLDGGRGYKKISGMIALGSTAATSSVPLPDEPPIAAAAPGLPQLEPPDPTPPPDLAPPTSAPPDAGRPATPPGPAGSTAMGASFLKHFDHNGDGVVTIDDFPPSGRRQFESLQRIFDKDGDGQITAEEFIGRRARRP